jgi:hypothetical protein
VNTEAELLRIHSFVPVIDAQEILILTCSIRLMSDPSSMHLQDATRISMNKLQLQTIICACKHTVCVPNTMNLPKDGDRVLSHNALHQLHDCRRHCRAVPLEMTRRLLRVKRDMRHARWLLEAARYLLFVSISNAARRFQGFDFNVSWPGVR